jgi:hypothetical protein
MRIEVLNKPRKIRVSIPICTNTGIFLLNNFLIKNAIKNEAFNRIRSIPVKCNAASTLSTAPGLAELIFNNRLYETKEKRKSVNK